MDVVLVDFLRMPLSSSSLIFGECGDIVTIRKTYKKISSIADLLKSSLWTRLSSSLVSYTDSQTSVKSYSTKYSCKIFNPVRYLVYLLIIEEGFMCDKPSVILFVVYPLNPHCCPMKTPRNPQPYYYLFFFFR